jgi:hypothetical protein
MFGAVVEFDVNHLSMTYKIFTKTISINGERDGNDDTEDDRHDSRRNAALSQLLPGD